MNVNKYLEPYQMTEDEWADRVITAMENVPGFTSATKSIIWKHREYVSKAISEGKRVPKKVLKEYYNT